MKTSMENLPAGATFRFECRAGSTRWSIANNLKKKPGEPRGIESAADGLQKEENKLALEFQYMYELSQMQGAQLFLKRLMQAPLDEPVHWLNDRALGFLRALAKVWIKKREGRIKDEDWSKEMMNEVLEVAYKGLRLPAVMDGLKKSMEAKDRSMWPAFEAIHKKEFPDPDKLSKVIGHILTEVEILIRYTQSQLPNGPVQYAFNIDSSPLGRQGTVPNAHSLSVEKAGIRVTEAGDEERIVPISPGDREEAKALAQMMSARFEQAMASGHAAPPISEGFAAAPSSTATDASGGISPAPPPASTPPQVSQAESPEARINRFVQRWEGQKLTGGSLRDTAKKFNLPMDEGELGFFLRVIAGKEPSVKTPEWARQDPAKLLQMLVLLKQFYRVVSTELLTELNDWLRNPAKRPKDWKDGEEIQGAIWIIGGRHWRR